MFCSIQVTCSSGSESDNSSGTSESDTGSLRADTNEEYFDSESE